MDAMIEFEADVRRQVKRAGGTCHFPMTRTVAFDADGTQVNGYWDEENLVMACAMDQPEDQRLRLLAHEFGHFRQYIEDRPAYTACYTGNAEQVGFGWVCGEDYCDDDAKVALGVLRNMELDCERVTLRILREYSLPMDVEEYCRRAAAYVYFYHVMAEHRVWYTAGKEPYNIPGIVDLMPTTLEGDFNTIPKFIMDAMVKLCLDD